MYKKLALIAILFSCPQVVVSSNQNSSRLPDGISESYLQVVIDGCINFDNAINELLDEPSVEFKAFESDCVHTSTELVLGNSYISCLIRRYIPTETTAQEKKEMYEFHLKCRTPDELSMWVDVINDNQERCKDAVSKNNFIECKQSIEMLKLLSARFSEHADSRNYIASWKDFPMKENFFHYVCYVNPSDNIGHPLYRKMKYLIMHELYKNGVDVNGKCICGQTPMHRAARLDNVAGLDFLYNHGGDMNARSIHDYTPIHDVVIFEAVEACKFLLKHNADTTIVNSKGMTAEQLAIDERFLNHNKIQLIEFLLTSDRLAREEIFENRKKIVQELEQKISRK